MRVNRTYIILNKDSAYIGERISDCEEKDLRGNAEVGTGRNGRLEKMAGKYQTGRAERELGLGEE